MLFHTVHVTEKSLQWACDSHNSELFPTQNALLQVLILLGLSKLVVEAEYVILSYVQRTVPLAGLWIDRVNTMASRWGNPASLVLLEQSFQILQRVQAAVQELQSPNSSDGKDYIVTSEHCTPISYKASDLANESHEQYSHIWIIVYDQYYSRHSIQTKQLQAALAPPC